jgi:hypothetical protein
MKYYNAQAFFDEKDEGQMSRWLLKFTVKANSSFTLSFRIPDWVTSGPVITINGEEFSNYIIKDGYLNIEKDWVNDEIQIYFPVGLHFVSLPDMPEMTAVLEGPIVLAGLHNADEGLYLDEKHPENTFMLQAEHTYSTFPWKQSTYLTKNQPKNMTFVPLYDITDEEYTIYFTKK